MTDRADLPVTSEWDWVYGPAGADFGASFTFARGASPEQVMTAFRMDPGTAQLLPADWQVINQALRYPPDSTYPPEHPWIRVGRSGEWAFAIDESAGGYGGYEEDAAIELSVGTDVVLFTHNAALDGFHYYVEGISVTQFEPLLAWDRFGTDPDRFLPQMRQVGLSVEEPSPYSDFRDPVIALLEMLTLALGIRLPREVALGPLLTVQRD
jgi:Family of unknown function (DUF6461)